MQKNSYDFFAVDYHNKRRHHWKDLEFFLKELYKKGFHFSGYNLDLGCANGRNFDLFLPATSKIVGIDNSIELLKLARERISDQEFKLTINPNNIDLILGDLKSIPLRPSVINNIFSIATIHHIKSTRHRKDVVSQVHEISKINGFIIITVWRRYQRKYRLYFITNKLKRIFVPKYLAKEKDSGLFEFGDKYIPWTVSKKKLTFKRFYHFFTLNEVKKLLKSFHIEVISKRGGPSKKDNFFILAQKINTE